MKIVDSSVSLKWFVDEPRREEARALLESDNELIAPELSYSEVANVLRRKVRGNQIAAEQASAAIGQFPALVSLERVTESLMQRAFGLAAELDHSVYDCIFLALALVYDEAVLVTDDSKFAEKAASAGYGEKIRMLSDGPIRIAFSDKQLDALLKLFNQSKDILDFVTSKVGRPSGNTGLRVYSTGDLQPAYDSPPYVRLKNAISQLTFQQTSALLAVAWLGRGAGSSELSNLFQQASHLAAEPERHAPYIIGQLNYLERGIAKLEGQSVKDA